MSTFGLRCGGSLESADEGIGVHQDACLGFQGWNLVGREEDRIASRVFDCPSLN